MQCICGHDEELHDAYAGKCDHCDCDIFRVDVSALVDQLAALTAERDALQSKVDALILFINGKITNEELEGRLRSLPGTGRAW